MEERQNCITYVAIKLNITNTNKNLRMERLQKVHKIRVDQKNSTTYENNIFFNKFARQNLLYDLDSFFSNTQLLK